MKNIFVMILIIFFINLTVAQTTSVQTPKKSSDEDIQSKKISEIERTIGSIRERIKIIDSELKTLKELEVRQKEATNAIGELNRQSVQTDSNIGKLNMEIQAIKKEIELEKSEKEKSTLQSTSLSYEQLKKISSLETEISLLKQEISRINERINVQKDIIEKEKTVHQVSVSGNELKDMFTSPWVGFMALVISIIALFTPTK